MDVKRCRRDMGHIYLPAGMTACDANIVAALTVGFRHRRGGASCVGMAGLANRRCRLVEKCTLQRWRREFRKQLKARWHLPESVSKPFVFNVYVDESLPTFAVSRYALHCGNSRRSFTMVAESDRRVSLPWSNNSNSNNNNNNSNNVPDVPALPATRTNRDWRAARR